MTKQTDALLVSVRKVVSEIVDQDSLSPDNQLVGQLLTRLTDLVYSANLSESEQEMVLKELSSEPLSGARLEFYKKISGVFASVALSSMLDLLRTISVVSEIEHDKVLSLKAADMTKTELEEKLRHQFKRSIPLPFLPETGNQIDQKEAAFALMLGDYPYNWSKPRAKSEMIAYDHLLTDAITDGVVVAYFCPSPSPFASFALLCHAKEQGKKTQIVIVDNEKESAAIGQKHIEKLEELGIIDKGEMQVIYASYDRPVDFQRECGKVPEIALIAASVPKKSEIAQHLRQSNVEVVTALNVDGMANLMYFPLNVDEFKEIYPLKALSLPLHLVSKAETLHAEQPGVAVVLPPEEPEGRFWVTPTIFSEKEWHQTEHAKVLNPVERILDASNSDKALVGIRKQAAFTV